MGGRERPGHFAPHILSWVGILEAAASALDRPTGDPVLGLWDHHLFPLSLQPKHGSGFLPLSLGHLTFPRLASQLLFHLCNQGPVLNSLCGKYWMEFLLSSLRLTDTL